MDVHYAEMVGMFKRVTGAAHVHVFHHQLRAARDNFDSNGFYTTVQPYAHAVQSGSSRQGAEAAFPRFAGNAVDAKFCTRRLVYINAWSNITLNNRLAVCDETSVVAPDEYLGSDWFMIGARLMQYGLSNHKTVNDRWYYFLNMQMEEMALYKQSDSDTALPGRLMFHTTFDDPTARSDAPGRQSIVCRVLLFFPDVEPNTCPALSSDTVAESVDLAEDHAVVEASVQKDLGLIEGGDDFLGEMSWPMMQ